MTERRPDELRLELVRLRATAAERERWTSEAQAAGMTLSGFVRQSVEDAVATRGNKQEEAPLPSPSPPTRSARAIPLEERLAGISELVDGLDSGRSSG